MSYFSDIQSRLNQTIKAIDSGVEFVGDAMVEQKRAELRAGVSADGGNISPAYSFNYAAYKKELSSYNAPDGTPDLYVSGDFHAAIAYTQKGWEWFLTLRNPQPYMNDLMSIYSEPSGITQQGDDSIALRAYTNIIDRWRKIW